MAAVNLLKAVYDGSGNPTGLAELASGDTVAPVLEGYAEVANTNTASGTAATLSLASGSVADLTLTANCTLTLAGAPAAGWVGSLTVILRQDATGGRTVTWPASVKWGGAVAPTLSTAASAVDIITLFTVDGGTTWYGFTSGRGMG